ncbi:MAG: GNAT family N-acetyltransferase [Candidatus Thermoplasmatota archaeon]|uniref:GNAT family N-acetyltransferase n=2 Tax=Candidatus Sysuiplasma superficiale TaxID=2823368 RepID=A0A8J7YJH3_9ARCH|nr:GNAT family N-acetyltransferase [Candidatus Sysuiplasma superficiale]MCL4346852.1 GNAT family N-acetyltransferase [Candidatus Thermoplasmatota archaeon]
MQGRRLIQGFGKPKVLRGGLRMSTARFFPKDRTLPGINDEIGKYDGGWLRFGTGEGSPYGHAWLWNIFIFTGYRRMGYATAVLHLLEDRLRSMGIEGLSLHVFGNNREALALYSKTAFVVTDVNMSRSLN